MNRKPLTDVEKKKMEAGLVAVGKTKSAVAVTAAAAAATATATPAAAVGLPGVVDRNASPGSAPVSGAGAVGGAGGNGLLQIPKTKIVPGDQPRKAPGAKA
jgi:hypothetical protein